MRQPLRIGLLYSLGSPWARQLAYQMALQGVEVHFFTFDAAGTGLGYLKNAKSAHEDTKSLLEQKNIHIHMLPSIGKGLLRYFFAAPSLYLQARSLKINSLLAIYAGGFGLLALLSGVRPFAVFTIGDDILILKGLRARMVNVVLSFSQKIFAHGGHLARQTQLRTRHLVENRVFGIDTNYFRPSDTQKNLTKIISTRGFEHIYNNHYILEAIKLLPENFEFELVFTSAGSLLEAEKSFTATLPKGLRAKVRFLEGVSRDVLLAELQSSSFFLSVSLSDGAAISVQEAMACGLYPILSDIPSNREWMNKEVGNGVTVPLGKPQNFAQTLQESLSMNAESFRRASAYNRQYIVDNCDAPRNTRKIIEELGKLND